jgi:hypothetical protein
MIDTRRTALYRIYDADDRMLYAGIGFNPFIRLTRHGEEKDWWEEAARVDIEWFDTRAEAEAAEVRTIEQFRPPGNTKHIPVQPPPRFEVRPDEEAPYLTSHVAQAFRVSTTTVVNWEKRGMLIPIRRPHPRSTTKINRHYSERAVREFADYWESQSSA